MKHKKPNWRAKKKKVGVLANQCRLGSTGADASLPAGIKQDSLVLPAEKQATESLTFTMKAALQAPGTETLFR